MVTPTQHHRLHVADITAHQHTNEVTGSHYPNLDGAHAKEVV